MTANGTTRIIAARQVQPRSVATPTASGVTSPTPAAAALPRLSIAGPRVPLCSCRIVFDTLTSSAPANPITSMAGRVTNSSTPCSSEPPVKTRTPMVSTTMPRQATPYRRQRRPRPTPTNPAITTPAASIRLCRPATALVVPSSSRNSGNDGPMP